MTMATMTAITTTAPAIIMGGDTGERRARGVSSSPRSTKARNRPVLALGSCSNSDMWTTLAGQRLAMMPDSVQLQGIGASASARSTSRDRTITLLVLTTKDSARMRSMTSSKCLTSVALM